MTKPGHIRIIAGKWRGRTLKVLDHTGLRPTPDRVRETLFNWLAPFIVGARCVDLFAGTGAIGFEALSRGAKEVVFIDNHPAAIRAIQENAEKFQATGYLALCSEAIAWLKAKTAQPFDIIFLDPPFSSPLLQTVISYLATAPCIKAGTHIYIESSTLIEDLPPTWSLLKHKKAGDVHSHLVEIGA